MSTVRKPSHLTYRWDCTDCDAWEGPFSDVRNARREARIHADGYEHDVTVLRIMEWVRWEAGEDA